MSLIIHQLNQLKNSQKKALAVLIDPDQDPDNVLKIAQTCQNLSVDFIFIGGSLITQGNLNKTIQIVKKVFKQPIYLFPGNEMMIDPDADGILLLSLISGRNPEYLIGKHIVAAPYLVKSKLDIVSTAYILIDGGKETSVSYISNTKPIPADKPDIAAATALAGQLIGMSCIYLDAGSGAIAPVTPAIVNKIKTTCSIPVIVGGGIRSQSSALSLYKAGADVLVIGNGTEKNPDLINDLVQLRNSISQTVEI